MGGDSGVWYHPAAPVWPRPDWYEEPGKQLLPQFCHASALHRPRLPEQVSTPFYEFFTILVRLYLLVINAFGMLKGNSYSRLPVINIDYLLVSLPYRYVSNIGKIIDEAPSDPTQDFKTQV